MSYWDIVAIGSVKKCCAPVLNALVHIVTTEPHLLHAVRMSSQSFSQHNCCSGFSVQLVYPANMPHPGFLQVKIEAGFLSLSLSLCLSLVAFVTATSSPFLSPLFSSCSPYLRPTSQPISQVVLATAQSDSSPVHLR